MPNSTHSIEKALPKLIGAFSALAPAEIMVIGDFLLDTYTLGVAQRISPEAPVAIIHKQKEEHRAGGAGNVALNLLALGATVRAVGRLGEDISGHLVREALHQAGCFTTHIYSEKGLDTIVKNRIIADSQQVVRVDHENVVPLSHELEQRIISQLPKLLDGIKLVAISDYGKGFLTPTLLEALFKEAKRRHIPTFVDPKGADFLRYKGATLIKPNRSESYKAASLETSAPLEKAAQKLLKLTEVQALLVTCSSDGIALFYPEQKPYYYPVRMQKIKDVTGAGDTVLATLAFTAANGLPFDISAQLANISAGIAIEQLGCAAVTLEALAERLLSLDVGNKIFDKDHLFALEMALRSKNVTIVTFDGDILSCISFLRAIHTLKQQQIGEILLWREQPLAASEARFLATLKDIDYLVLAEKPLETFTRQIKPVAIYRWDNEQLLLQKL